MHQPNNFYTNLLKHRHILWEMSQTFSLKSWPTECSLHFNNIANNMIRNVSAYVTNYNITYNILVWQIAQFKKKVLTHLYKTATGFKFSVLQTDIWNLNKLLHTKHTNPYIHTKIPVSFKYNYGKYLDHLWGRYTPN